MSPLGLIRKMSSVGVRGDTRANTERLRVSGDAQLQVCSAVCSNQLGSDGAKGWCRWGGHSNIHLRLHLVCSLNPRDKVPGGHAAQSSAVQRSAVQ